MAQAVAENVGAAANNNLVTEVDKIRDAEADTGVRTIRRIEIGHAIHQGDVYVHKVAENHPRGQQIGMDQVQIAIGQGVGAHHVAVGDGIKVFQGTTLPETVTTPEDIEASALIGPVVLAEKSFKVTHPEHAHFTLPAGTYQVTYQVDMRTMQRVVD